MLITKSAYKNLKNEIDEAEIKHNLKESVKHKVILFESEPLYDCSIKQKVGKPYLWQLWLQGVDEAPQIIKNCFSSVDYFCNEFEIIRLDRNSIFTYLAIDKIIHEKWLNSTISDAHFSDFIRNELLYNYGGLWLDASVLLTDKIDFVIEKEIFYLTGYVNKTPKSVAIKYGSWLMWTMKPGFKLYKIVRDLEIDYWKNNNYICNYFLYHILWSTVEDYDAEIYSKMRDMSISFGNYSIMFFHYWVYETYNFEKFKFLTTQTPWHKLNAKTPPNISGNEKERIWEILNSKELFSEKIWKPYLISKYDPSN